MAEKLDEEYFIEKEQNINELAENIEKEKKSKKFLKLLWLKKKWRKKMKKKDFMRKKKIIDIPAPIHHHEENLSNF